jgi:hypothetical protein
MKGEGHSERRIHPLVIPLVVLLALVGSLAYYMVLKAQEREILGQIQSLRLALEEKRRVLKSIEDMERIRALPMVAAIGRWVQGFQDPLDARMKVEENLAGILRNSGALEVKAKWEDSWESDGLKQGQISASASMPSFESLLKALGSLESGPMPMILRSLEVRKDGVRLRVNLKVSIYYRVEHDSL